eukprot:15484938-Alexandrium_andersonii.AAC.1
MCALRRCRRAARQARARVAGVGELWEARVAGPCRALLALGVGRVSGAALAARPCGEWTRAARSRSTSRAARQ